MILTGIDFGRVSLRGASLHATNLMNADLRHADLTGANLTEADLISANLEGAILRGATLREADLLGARLAGAQYSDEDLRARRCTCPREGPANHLRHSYGGREGHYVRRRGSAEHAEAAELAELFLGFPL